MPENTFADLCALMARLRAPDGCPWDREQTHESIKGHLIEEAYETADAIGRGDVDELKEELGDLLLQVVFHAQMAAEAGNFTIDDVIADIVTKLKRRHPHVFADVRVDSSKDVLLHWEEIKAGEKDKGERSYLAGVPAALPALALAEKLQERAARVGFDWPASEDILDKLSEEMAEFVASEEKTPEIEEEFGDILFTLVNLSRHLGIDAELALRRVADKFRRRFQSMEQLAKAREQDFASLSLEEKDRLWGEVKK